MINVVTLTRVPQNSVLEPFLFNNYMIQNYISPTIRLYIDNALSYRTNQNENDVYTLQKDLDSIWSAVWQMSLNPKKTTF